jgi:hypothetical protein
VARAAGTVNDNVMDNVCATADATRRDATRTENAKSEKCP